MHQIVVKVSSAFMYNGKMCKPGNEVEVSRKDAVSLCQRGKAVPLAEVEEDLAEKSVQELRSIADDLGIDAAKMKKPDLIAAIKAADEGDE